MGKVADVGRGSSVLANAALVALVAAAITWVVDTPPAGALVSPTQQWLTSVTGTISSVGDSLALGFGSSGVTGTYTMTFKQDTGSIAPNPLNVASGQANALTYLEPDPPAASATVSQFTGLSLGKVIGAVALSRPLVQPILHVVNSDAAFIVVGGTSTTGAPITVTPLVKNNALEITGNKLNSTAQTPSQNGCMVDGTNANPTGGCGSIALTAASGLIQSFTIESTLDILGQDGWQWALSFPTAPLTAAFSPASIPSGGSSSLTFTIANPNDPGSTTLSPLGFTTNLPAGVTLANGTSATKGNCGPVVVDDGAGNPLAGGGAVVRAAAAGVAPGATCVLTVTTTSTASGPHFMTPSSVTTTAGNLISQVSAVLAVGLTGAPAQQWPTSVTGTIGQLGDSLALAFVPSAVTGTYTITTLVNGAVAPGPANIAAGQANALMYLEPDPPALSATVSLSALLPAGRIVGNVALNKGLVQPILHVVNPDGSKVTIGGTSTTAAPITIAAIAKNDALDITGTTLNSTAQQPINDGCMVDGTNANPNGGCGSIALLAASGLIQNFTLDNVLDFNGNDGWQWSLSFPTAPLTAAFSPAAISSGAQATLTFTIANPNGPGSTTLTPLDFTATLPAGVTLATGTTSNNGSCGPVVVDNGAGNPLAAGGTVVRATAASVAPGATCTVTVTATSTAVGPHAMTASSATSTVGNLISQVDTTLTVQAQAITCASPLTPTITGTAGHDLIVGTEGDDVIFGLGGNDNIRGLGGNDIILGGPGNDYLDGGAGNDLLCGGDGNDFLGGGANDDSLSGDAGFDRLSGGEGNDSLLGGSEADYLDGGPGTNTTDGGAGSDSCVNPSGGASCEVSP